MAGMNETTVGCKAGKAAPCASEMHEISGKGGHVVFELLLSKNSLKKSENYIE
jgi:hypothetical protein